MAAKEAPITPDSLDIAWAAGFMEGDGTFYRRPNHGSIFVQVHQVNQEPLRRLYLLFGGAISQLPAKNTHSAKGVWTLNGSRAIGFMLTVYTFLSQKRRAQVRRALPPKGVTPWPERSKSPIRS